MLRLGIKTCLGVKETSTYVAGLLGEIGKIVRQIFNFVLHDASPPGTVAAICHILRTLKVVAKL